MKKLAEERSDDVACLTEFLGIYIGLFGFTVYQKAL